MKGEEGITTRKPFYNIYIRTVWVTAIVVFYNENTFLILLCNIFINNVYKISPA